MTGVGASAVPCVVAWLDAGTGVFHFFWRDGPAGAGSSSGWVLSDAQHLAATLKSEAIAGSGTKTPLAADVHAGFGQALATTSVPAQLLTLDCDENPLNHHSDRLRLLLSEAERAAGCSLGHGPFAVAARRFGPGSDRRILQMAVQYLANGGLDDSVVAAEYDQAFLADVRRELEKKKP